jgi:capsular exopolysaccharide synthesis family protein
LRALDNGQGLDVEIRDFFRILGRHRILVPTVFLLILGVGVEAAYLRANRYRATATVLAQPANGKTDFNSVDAVRFVLPSVVEEVGTISFRERVRANLPFGVTLSGVSIKASLEQGTGILRVSAESGDKGIVTTVSNIAAQTLVKTSISPSLQLSVLDPAHHPVSASARLRGPILVSAFVFGLIIAVFAALIRDAFDNRVRSNEEISERLGLEILGEIPAQRHFPRSPAELFADPKYARTAEAYQRLVANLEITLSTDDVRTIAITSSASGEGKTTVTTCLAWALALLGHEVVAIDGDLRKPTLHARLGVELGDGLANARNGDVRGLERRTQLDSLSALPAGATTVHPAQVVSQQLPEVLTAFNDRLVLVDSPPALAAAEATLIAMMTKNVILVIDRTSRGSEEIDRVLHELRRANVKVLGVVVNRAKPKRSAGMYDDYYMPIRAATQNLARAERQRRERAARTRAQGKA